MRSQEAHDDDDVVNYGLSEILALSKIKVSSARPDQAAELAVTPLLGMRVAINGLVAKPELNGRTGTAVRFDDDEGRYWVELDDTSSSCMIKPCNLLPAGCTPSGCTSSVHPFFFSPSRVTKKIHPAEGMTMTQ